jgi:hypothetical protein
MVQKKERLDDADHELHCSFRADAGAKQNIGIKKMGMKKGVYFSWYMGSRFFSGHEHQRKE